MKTAFLAGAAASALLIHAPTGALALTPQEVWDRWQEQAASADITITAGDESTSGGALTLSNVAFAAAFDDDASMTGTIAEVMLSDAGDGTVRVTMSDEIPLTLNGSDDDGSTMTSTVTVSAPDLVYTVAEAPEDATDASYSAPLITMTINSIVEDGEPLDMNGTVTATDVSGAYVVSGGEPQQIENSLASASLAMDFAGTDPEDGGEFSFNLVMDDIETSSSSTGGMMFTLMSDSDLLEAGGSANSEGSAGAVSLTTSTRSDGEAFDLSLTLEGGTGASSLDADRIAYDLVYDGLSFAASGSSIPFPQATGSLGTWETRFSLPTGPTDTAVPADFKLALRDVVLGEEIWMMFDPAGVLGRDPATVVLDLASQTRVLRMPSIMSLAMGGDLPVEPEALTLRELLVSLAGARLAGQGDFAFDWQQPGPFGPGTPRADGTLDLSLTGGEALLEKLVGMSLISQGQADGILGFLAVIGESGEAPDEIVSSISITPEGRVSANGMMLPLPF